LPNKETLRQLTLADVALLGPGYRRDQERFAREFARRYFAVTASAVRRHDPHHLILGCRFGAEPGAAVRAECGPPHVDVVSLGCDDETLPERIAAGHCPHAMPVLVGEFGWTGAAFKREAATGDWAGKTTVERMLGRGRATVNGRLRIRIGGLRMAALGGPDGPDGRPLAKGWCTLTTVRRRASVFSDLNRRATGLRLGGGKSCKTMKFLPFPHPAGLRPRVRLRPHRSYARGRSEPRADRHGRSAIPADLPGDASMVVRVVDKARSEVGLRCSGNR